MKKGSYTRILAGQDSRRPEQGPLRSQYEANRKIILATQSVCGICGRPVDKSLKSPHPLSPTVDHIIPVNKHGDPIALENLQLAHRSCNRAKSDKVGVGVGGKELSKKTAPYVSTRYVMSQNWMEY